MATYEWQETTAPKKRRYDDIWFISPSIGWAVNSSGQILKTEDAGESWTEQAQIGVSTWLRCITFVNENIGWVGSTTRRSKLWHTKNGGLSWTKISNLPSQPTAVCGLWAVDENIVYASGTNYPNRPTAVMKTTDGGNNWVSIDMGQHASLLVDIYFQDQLHGWVVGGFGGQSRSDVKPVVLYTEDGGETWENQLEGMDGEFPKGEWGWKIQFLDELTGFVSLENFNEGAILKTKDGGKTWVRLPINDQQGNANLEGIGFLNATTGWVGGWGDREAQGGYTSESVDGGLTWTDANHVGKFINRFRFTGDQNIVAYASGDTIYRYAADSSRVGLLSMLPAKNILQKPLIISETVAEFKDTITISVNVPVGANRFTVEVWDRFAEHIKEVHDELNPAPGLHRILWDFTDSSGGEVGNGHYIYRVTIDSQADSRVIFKNK